MNCLVYSCVNWSQFADVSETSVEVCYSVNKKRFLTNKAKQMLFQVFCQDSA